MERKSTPDRDTLLIKHLRQRRDAGMISQAAFGYCIWYIWERWHGRIEV